MPEVYVAVGGNVEPLKYVRRALTLLEEEFGALAVSPAYRNPAVGFAGEDFINLVVAFETMLSPAAVREKLQSVERRCDRPAQSPRWAARTMDLDILLYDGLVSDAPGLELPRPDLLRKAYMLRPLAEIAPELIHPVEGRTMRALWETFGGADHDMVRLSEWRTAGSGQ